VSHDSWVHEKHPCGEEVAWERAVKMRLAAEATDRLKKRAAKAGVSYAQIARRRRARRYGAASSCTEFKNFCTRVTPRSSHDFAKSDPSSY
jgi:hypothetical protein